MANASIIGSIKEFESSHDNWLTYKRRIDAWLRINKIEEDQKVDVLIALVGSEAVDLLVSLCTPNDITTKSYEDLTAMLSRHYHCGENEVISSYQFDTRNQAENETISDYIVALQKLSINCAFGDENQLNKRLRNRLVVGVKEDAIRNRLLAEHDLSWKRACEIAIQMDMARYGSKLIHAQSSVNAVKQHKSQQQHRFVKPKSASHIDSDQKCYRCHGKHTADACRFKNAKCFNCNKIGHISKACRNKGNSKTEFRGSYQQKRGGRTNHISHDDDEALYEVRDVASVNVVGSDEVKVDVDINGTPISFTVDTASSVSIISEETYTKHFKSVLLRDSKAKLRGYTGHSIELVGEITVIAKYNGQEFQLPLLVAEGKRTSLFGRNWMERIRLNWEEILHIERKGGNSLERLLKQYKTVFADGYGEMTPFKAHITLKDDVAPIFHKARPVPYSLREKVDKELDKQVGAGILKKVERSEWASPVVIVPKPDGSVRICSDYKVSINKVVEDTPYPLPTADDIFSTLAGGQAFTKIDLSNAFNQLKVDESSSQYLTINTTKGLFQPTRLPYGIKTAPLMFQNVMDQVLHGIPGVCCYIDDILITANSEAEHLHRLETVLQRLESHGIRAKHGKCSFLMSEVDYLGHKIDAIGIHPLADRVESIRNAKVPENVTELRQLLGLINYYGKFLNQLSTTLAPLHSLLRADAEWKWTTDCDAAVKTVKDQLTGDQLLIHYDPNKPLVLSCDASAYGVGAVLSHMMPDGSERPIAFSSRTLTKSERNYAQLEKEAMSIIFGVKKFHKYIYGRKFSLLTDHKALTTIFGPRKGVPTLAALRLQRWSLILMAYDYDITYRRSEEHSNADFLSRAPTNVATENLELDVNYFTYTNDLPITAKEIGSATMKDPVLSRVKDFVMHGWPGKVDANLEPYHRRRDELSVDQNCVLWGLRVIIPERHQSALLQQLHEDHFGIVRTKAIARNYFWFPGIDKSIEHMISACPTCQTVQHDPVKSPLMPWKYPSHPWSRVHADFAMFRNMNYLVVVDSFSKWFEVVPMKSTTASRTVEELRKLFAQHGLPEELVSDNGPQFIASEFEVFMRSNGVKHTKCAPYHPASNGQVERVVQILKTVLHKHTLDKSGVSESQRLQSFLLTYRTTPHAVTGRTPAELFLKRQLRTRLTLLKPNLMIDVQKKQEKQVNYRDQHSSTREFNPMQLVRVKNCYDNGVVKFVLGSIVKRLGPLRYLVRVGHRTRYCHVDHLRSTGETTADTSDEESTTLVPPGHDRDGVTTTPTQAAPLLAATPTPTRAAPSHAATPKTSMSPSKCARRDDSHLMSPAPPHDVPIQQNPATPPSPRRSTRVRRSPLRFES